LAAGPSPLLRLVLLKVGAIVLFAVLMTLVGLAYAGLL
jgi:hypothetical protein